MPSSPQFLLTLNDTTLVVLPRTCTSLVYDCVTQIHVKSITEKPDVDTLATYFLRQREVTLAIAYTSASRAPPTNHVMNGKDYLLDIETREWVYGRSLELRWGEERLVPCAVKWIVTFRAI